MSAVATDPTLTGQRRTELVRLAERIAEVIEQRTQKQRKSRHLLLTAQACQQAAVALAILHRHGPDRLREILDHERTDAAAPPWQELRIVLRSVMDKFPWQGPHELAFVLGWLHRIGKIRRATHSTNQQRDSQGGGRR